MKTKTVSEQRIRTESAASSDPFVSNLTTRSGFSLKLRSANESDGPLLAEFFGHVSKDDIRFRFLSGMKQVGSAQLALLTRFDHGRADHLLAFHPTAGFLLASAMLALEDDPEQAEVAIALHADFKNHGIGWCLLDHLANVAASMGVRTIRSIENRGNRSAIELEREMGFTSRSYPGDSTLMLLEKTLVDARSVSAA